MTGSEKPPPLRSLFLPCRNCGRNLAALSPRGVCPTCSEPYNIEPAEAPSPDPDWLCPMCGYSLTGLAPSGTCPECANSYTPASVAQIKPHPGQTTLALHLGWSGAIFAVAAVAMVLINPGASIFCLLSVIPCAILWFIRVPITIRTYLPRQDRRPGRFRNLWKLGPLVFIAACSNFVVVCLAALALIGFVVLLGSCMFR
ncbi:MAG: hypothetical protein JSR77_01180 [Planctomycetes bacterium]|nr:hypothetical protein [Planctomycetota bacterium]